MGFFATFWPWLNGQLATYIGDNTARLASILEPAIVTVADDIRHGLGLSSHDGKDRRAFRRRVLSASCCWGWCLESGCGCGCTTP